MSDAWASIPLSVQQSQKSSFVLLPVITIIGNSMGMMLAGTFVIEMIFAIPYVGWYLVGWIGNRDYAIAQSSVIFLAITFTLIMLLVDQAYAFIQPACRLSFWSPLSVRN